MAGPLGMRCASIDWRLSRVYMRVGHFLKILYEI